MKAKEITEKNIDDFEIVLHEHLGFDEGGFPNIKKTKLMLSDIGYTSKVIVLEKIEE